MIEGPRVSKAAIRRHYDVVTPFYRVLWGRHIHHGLWEGDSSPAAAQEHLVERVAHEANIARGANLLDVGCGMGAAAIYLARTRGCRVTGITLSRVQQLWARGAAYRHRVGPRVFVRRGDAEEVVFPAEAFDSIYSIECTEHLFDKAAFFHKVATWLRPGGTLAICAWLAADQLNREAEEEVRNVCEKFFCPSLGRAGDYRDWMTTAGLRVKSVHDWTEDVAQTWEIAVSRSSRAGMHHVARYIFPHQSDFVHDLSAVLGAYRSGAMRYGCLVAQKPAEEGGAAPRARARMALAAKG